MKHLIFLPLLLLAGCHPSCNWNHRSKSAEVTSFGYGAIRVAPDMARFTVEASSIRGTLQEASDETRKTMDEIVSACRKSIPDSGDIQTTQLTIGKNFEWVNGANVFKGYSASQSVQITLRDLSKMDALTQAVLETHVTGISNLEFDCSKSDSLRGEASALAMMDAKKTVQKMCAAVNTTCDHLLSAKTVEGPGQGPIFDRGFSGTMAAKAAPSGIPVSAGMQTFSAAVEATYR